jgi:predicted RNA-binding protein
MIQAKGGIHAASRSWDIQEGNLRAVMEGRAKPGPRLAKALGITQKADGEWVVTRIFGS